MNFGTPLLLSTHQEMAKEMTNRQDLPCLVVYRTMDGCYHIYDNIDRDCGIAEKLRKLADLCEDDE